MLRLERVTAGWGAAEVIRGVDIAVAQGETLALLGPNGAGKSTLLAAVTGTLPRRGGRILFEGRDLVAAPSHEIVSAGLALVPEGRLMFAPMTVEDNLRLGSVRLGSGQRGGQGVEERFQFVYALFPRLAERRRQRAGTLSGGEQQMVAIGRALMSAPRVLLLDEPFLGLAPIIAAEIREALARLRDSGLTMLIVEQKLDIALGFASRACIMIKGRVVLEDSTENLARRSDLTHLYFDLAERES